MKKIKKIIKNNIVGIIIGVIIAITISAYAATMLQSSAVYYDNSKSGGSSNTVSGAIDELYEKAKTTDFKVGDYVSMTPSSTSFTIPKTLTGYDTDQTINPSELNLWRVIRINDDKTVDMVSVYVSSTVVYFQGQTGYQNCVGVLNYIAKQYENPNYTVGSRHMGYNGQTEYITDTINAPNWLTDSLYETDRNLVETAIGSLNANKVKTTTLTSYYLAGRCITGTGTPTGSAGSMGLCEAGSSSGGGVSSWFYNFNCDKQYNCTYVERNTNKAIRPIVILKSKIKASSGNGTSALPYVLD